MTERELLELRAEYDFLKYLEKLQILKDKCIILMAVKDTPGSQLSEEEMRMVRNLGFQSFSKELWVMYLGITVKGVAIKDESGKKPEQNLDFEIMLDELKVRMESKSWKSGNDCVIELGEKDYARKIRGINIVVYDLEEKRVVDSIGYDKHGTALHFGRNYMNFKAAEYRERCVIKKILPMNLDKLKVRIVPNGSAHFWNVIASLVQELSKDKNIDLKILVGPYDRNGKRSIVPIISELNIPFEYLDNVDLISEDVDVLIFLPLNGMEPFQKMIKDFRKNSKLLVCLPVAIILNAYNSMKKYELQLVNKLQAAEVDYLILDKYMYEKCKQEGISGDFIVELGNPKFDAIHNKLSLVKELPKEWDKLKGKKIILWLVDHDWETGTNVSFDIYVKKMMEIMSENQDLALIFRPHPCFEGDMKRFKIWSEKDVTEFKAYINNSPNIVWDEAPDYSMAYQAADFIFSDVASGTIISAMVTKKPICILYRNDCIVIDNNSEITENYYSVKNEEELERIIAMIRTGDDPMQKQRWDAIDKYVSHFDGKNGERIKNFILEKYYEKYGQEQTVPSITDKAVDD